MSPSEAPSTRPLWALAWPMMLSNLSLPALTLVDAAVLGHLPEPQHLAAVVLGSTLFSFLFWGFGFLRMGTTGQVAQGLGAASAGAEAAAGPSLRVLLGQGLTVALGASALCWLAGPVLIPQALEWLNASADVAPVAERYALIRLLSAPAVLTTYVFVGTLVGLGEMRRVLAITVATQCLNIIFDLFFVLGLGLGAAGVAAGTVLAEGLGALLAVLQLRPALRRFPGSWGWRDLRAGYGAFLSLNSHLFIRTLALLGALAVFTAQGAAQGTVVVAANALLMNLFMAVSYALDGFAHACETLIGQALGRRDGAALRHWVRISLGLAFKVALGASLLFALAGEGFIALLTDLPEVRAAATLALPWLVALPVLAAGAFIFDGVFIGATATRAMRNTMLGAALLVYAPALLALEPLGNAGLWTALALFFFARSALLAGVYLRRGLTP